MHYELSIICDLLVVVVVPCFQLSKEYMVTSLHIPLHPMCCKGMTKLGAAAHFNERERESGTFFSVSLHIFVICSLK